MTSSKPGHSSMPYLVWLFGLVAGCVNIVLLFYPFEYSLFYLRLYRLGLSIFLAISVLLMADYLRRHSAMNRETEHSSLPRPLVIAGFILTLATCVGFTYDIIMLLALRQCDFITKARFVTYEVPIEIANDFATLLFTVITFYYVIQRKRFKGCKTDRDYFVKRCIEVALVLLTVHIVSLKATDKFLEICEVVGEKDPTTYCPIPFEHKFTYQCRFPSEYQLAAVGSSSRYHQQMLIRDAEGGEELPEKLMDEGHNSSLTQQQRQKMPSSLLRGSQIAWAYLYHYFVRPLVITLNQEIYPILFILHYIAEQGTQHQGPLGRGPSELRRQLETKALCERMRGKTSHRVAAIAAIVAAILVNVGNAAQLINIVNFDLMVEDEGENLNCNDDVLTTVLNNTTRLLMIAMMATSLWSLRKIRDKTKETNAELKREVHAKEDLYILAACCVCLTIRTILLAFSEETWYKTGDYCMFLAIIRTIFQLQMISIGWMQVQILYRLLTLEYEELISLGFFGPVLTMTGMLVNIYSFFQLFINQKRDEHTLESHADQFSMQGLLSLMAQQIVLPFCYLYYFTAFTCWLALWERYSVIGTFTLGQMTTVEDISSDATDIKKQQINQSLDQASDQQQQRMSAKLNNHHWNHYSAEKVIIDEDDFADEPPLEKHQMQNVEDTHYRMTLANAPPKIKQISLMHKNV